MAIVRDLLIVIVLCVLTGWLPTHFLEYRGKVVGAQPGENAEQFAPGNLVYATNIRTLNFTDTVVENGKTTARPGTMLIQNGFYARPGFSIPMAMIDARRIGFSACAAALRVK